LTGKHLKKINIACPLKDSALIQQRGKLFHIPKAN